MVENSCTFFLFFFILVDLAQYSFILYFSCNFLDLGIVLKFSFELVFLYKFVFFVTI